MKKVLIVGASSGIGKQLTKALLKDGNYELHLASRSMPDLEGDFKFQEVDVESEVKLELPDQLDGLVYCPGSINLKPFHRFSDEDFRKDFELNAMGAVRVVRQALKPLKKADQSSVIMFSTVAVQTGISFHSSIAAAKGAVEGLGRSLAAELAPQVRVNMIAPSLTDTPLAKNLLSSEEKRKSNADRHPLKRIGGAEDISNMAKFLLSDDSSWVTGQLLTVDGGLSKIR